MSFKFNFDLEEPESEGESSQPISLSITPTTGPQSNIASEDGVKSVWDEKSYSVSLDELLDTLPSRILYSPLPLPFPLSRSLLRRDLHDARFQLASTSTLSDITPADSSAPDSAAGSERAKVQGEDQGEAYVSAGAGTDLIPGLYEGGLKTWEGGVDLVQVLSEREGDGGVREWVRGRGVVEIGCGTALPSSYILSQLLSAPPTESTPSANDPTSTMTSLPTLSSPVKTKLLLQDYNLPVLTLVSLPNLLLASLPYLPLTLLEPLPTGSSDPAEAHLAEINEEPDFSDAGELEITPDLKQAFKDLLAERGVELEFRYGGWKGLAEELRGRGEGYGLVLSAETIYAEGSVGDLISVLRAASGAGALEKISEERMAAKEETSGVDGGLGLGELSVRDKEEEWDKVDLQKGGSVVLIAAKVLYFGVGGGLQDFLNRVEGEKGWWTPVKEWTKGVGRKVVRVGW